MKEYSTPAMSIRETSSGMPDLPNIHVWMDAQHEKLHAIRDQVAAPEHYREMQRLEDRWRVDADERVQGFLEHYRDQLQEFSTLRADNSLRVQDTLFEIRKALDYAQSDA